MALIIIAAELLVLLSSSSLLLSLRADEDRTDATDLAVIGTAAAIEVDFSAPVIVPLLLSLSSFSLLLAISHEGTVNMAPKNLAAAEAA